MKYFILSLFLLGSINADEFAKLYPFNKEDIQIIEKKLGSKVKTAELIMNYHYPETSFALKCLGHKSYQMRQWAIRYFSYNFNKGLLNKYLQETGDPEILANIKAIKEKKTPDQFTIYQHSNLYLAGIKEKYKGRKKFRDLVFGLTSLPLTKPYMENYTFSAEEYELLLSIGLKHPNLNLSLEMPKGDKMISYNGFISEEGPFATVDEFEKPRKQNKGKLLEKAFEALKDETPTLVSKNIILRSKNEEVIAIHFQKNFPLEFKSFIHRAHISNIDFGLDLLTQSLSSLDDFSPENIKKTVSFIKSRKYYIQYKEDIKYRFLMSSNYNCNTVGLYLTESIGIDKKLIFKKLWHYYYPTNPFIERLLQLKDHKEFLKDNAHKLLKTDNEILKSACLISLYEHKQIDLLEKEISWPYPTENFVGELVKEYKVKRLKKDLIDLKLSEDNEGYLFQALFTALKQKGIKADSSINSFLRLISKPKAKYSLKVIDAYKALKGNPDDALNYLSQLQDYESDENNKSLRYIISNASKEKRESFLKNSYIYNTPVFLKELKEIPGALVRSVTRGIKKKNTFNKHVLHSSNWNTALKELRKSGELTKLLEDQSICNHSVIAYWRFLFGFESTVAFSIKKKDIELYGVSDLYILSLLHQKPIDIKALKNAYKIFNNHENNSCYSPLLFCLGSQDSDLISHFPKINNIKESTKYSDTLSAAIRLSINPQDQQALKFLKLIIKNEASEYLSFAWLALYMLDQAPEFYSMNANFSSFLHEIPSEKAKAKIQKNLELLKIGKRNSLIDLNLKYIDKEKLVDQFLKTQIKKKKIHKYMGYDLSNSTVQLSIEDIQTLTNSKHADLDILRAITKKGQACKEAWEFLNKLKPNILEEADPIDDFGDSQVLDQSEFLFAASRLATTEKERKHYKEEIKKLLKLGSMNIDHYLLYMKKCNTLSKEELKLVEVYFNEDRQSNFNNKRLCFEILLEQKGLKNVKSLIEKNIDNPSLIDYFIELARWQPEFMKPYFPRLIENALIFHTGLELLKKSEVKPVLNKLQKTANRK